MICVAPFRGEFGITIRYHVPVVRGLARPLVVCHEPGLEALYPDCERIIVAASEDQRRYANDQRGADVAFVEMWRGRLAESYPGAEVINVDRRSTRPAERFVPEPHSWQIWKKWRRRGGIDVVICPRRREYAKEKNWAAWPDVAARLAGLTVFAAGAPETSYTNVRCTDAAWNYHRPLDATIEAMRQARLVVATDAGLAHLAVLIGVPLLIVGSSGGRVAPGPAADEKGKVHHTKYWPIRMDEYYHAANWTSSPIEMLPDGWEDPDAVVERVRELACGGVAA